MEGEVGERAGTELARDTQDEGGEGPRLPPPSWALPPVCEPAAHDLVLIANTNVCLLSSV